MKTGRILIVDDDPDILHAARLLLRNHVELVHTEKNPDAIPVLMKNESYDVVVLDMNFARGNNTGQEGFHWLDQILTLDPAASVVLITAFGDVEMAVRAIKEGATDFILKPWENDRLLATLTSALRLRKSRVEADKLRTAQQQLSADLDQPFQDFVGRAPVMLEVFDTIRKVARTSANVLLLGENGTGKELVARALHRESDRADEVFIKVDLGAISETLFESELFGHMKGAFTDAKEDRAGRFEIASGGTLFLDEIGNLSLPLQAKLLSVLQNREVFRVGANKPRPIDVRLICATNMPLYDMVGEKQFRQDLLYRINTVQISLPPLRERLEDLPLLLDHFLAIYCKKYKKTLRRTTPAVIKKLRGYPWPGNVRELQQVVERAVILGETNTLQPSDFFLAPTEVTEADLSLENLNLEEAEKVIIRKALRKHGGNISHAAKELGLTRAALYRRLEKYDL